AQEEAATEEDAQDWAKQALRLLEQAAGDGSVPEESRPLVISQAVDVAALAAAQDAGAQAESVSIPPQQRAAAEELLEWEYTQLFGLDFARSYASPEMEKDIDQRLEMHERRVLVLQAALEQLAKSADSAKENVTVPQPRPAYTAPAGEKLPVDAATAQSFVDALGWNDTLKWKQAATAAAQEGQEGIDNGTGKEKANPTGWLDWLIRTAGQSAAL
ncbi:MAG: hypothetical protein Q4E25_07530, partial [Corynebacterium sp.]|nr:hypothetical protein [Corynebacterium sp.]